MCNALRQRCVTAALRSSRALRNCVTAVATLAAVPKQVFAVTSVRTHFPIASAGL